MGYISTIHKKGSKDDCKNYRGITVTSTLSRLYGRVLKHFLEAEYKEMEAEEQAGFRVGRSTIDHIFFLQQITEKKTVRSQPLHLIFIDIKKKVYDIVPLANLWTPLRSTSINPIIIKAIQNVYNNSISTIKIGKNLSPGFQVTKDLSLIHI